MFPVFEFLANMALSPPLYCVAFWSTSIARAAGCCRLASRLLEEDKLVHAWYRPKEPRLPGLLLHLLQPVLLQPLCCCCCCCTPLLHHSSCCWYQPAASGAASWATLPRSGPPPAAAALALGQGQTARFPACIDLASFCTLIYYRWRDSSCFISSRALALGPNSTIVKLNHLTIWGVCSQLSWRWFKGNYMKIIGNHRKFCVYRIWNKFIWYCTWTWTYSHTARSWAASTSQISAHWYYRWRYSFSHISYVLFQTTRFSSWILGQFEKYEIFAIFLEMILYNVNEQIWSLFVLLKSFKDWLAQYLDKAKELIPKLHVQSRL